MDHDTIPPETILDPAPIDTFLHVEIHLPPESKYSAGQISIKVARTNPDKFLKHIHRTLQHDEWSRENDGVWESFSYPIPKGYKAEIVLVKGSLETRQFGYIRF